MLRRVVGGGWCRRERSGAGFRLSYVSNPGTGWSVYVEPEAHAAECVIESCHKVLEEGVAEQVDRATLLELYSGVHRPGLNVDSGAYLIGRL